MAFTLKPITGSRLVGRKELVDRLVQELRNKNSDTDYAFYGLRRVGKTSVLKEIKSKLEKEKDIVPVYVSLWQVFPFNLKTFLDRLIVKIIESYSSRLSLKHQVSKLMETPLVVLKKMLENLKLSLTLQEDLEFTLGFKSQPLVDYGALFAKAFSLPETLAKETNTKCVLFLDEFPSILEFNDGLALVRSLRTLHENQKHTVFCIAGSIRKHMAAVALSEASPFYKQFMTKEIKPLTKEDIKTLLEKSGQEYGIKVEEEASAEIYARTQGLPFYVQFLGKLAVEKQIKIFDKERAARLIDSFLDEEGSLLFLEYLKSFPPREQEILKVISQGIETLTEIANRTKENPSTISTYLLYLIDKGAVEKIERGRYNLVDNIFKQWLKEKISSP